MAKTKSVVNTKNWEKVWVIGGEPCLVHLSLSHLLDASERIKRYYKGDDVSGLYSVLNIRSPKRPTVVLYEPNAEMLKTCLSVVESNYMAVKALIVVVQGDNIDGRISFYSKASKNNRLTNYPYIETSDRQTFLKFLSGWESDMGIKISGEAKKWLLDNAPTVSVKIKASNKNVDAYDLETLHSELIKFSALYKGEEGISLSDIREFCEFEQTSDIWLFISSVITGDYVTAFTVMDSVVAEHGINSLLWLLNSQIAFLIQIKDLLINGVTDPTEIQNKLNYKRYLNKYTDVDCNELSAVNEPAINPWRIRKAIDTLRNSFCTMSRLSLQQNHIANAITDLRFGFPEDILLSYVILSLCGVTIYPSHN